MGIFPQNTVELSVLCREALDVARLVKPGQMHSPGDASVLAEDLKSFLKVTADRDLQIEMTQRSIFKLGCDEPAKAPETLEQPRSHGGDRSTQEPRRVDQVAAMCEQIIAAPVGFGIALRAQGLGARQSESAGDCRSSCTDRPSRSTTT